MNRVIKLLALMLIIFIIPHSTLGSEIDYTEMENLADSLPQKVDELSDQYYKVSLKLMLTN